jgi:WD40 repeat protein
MKVHVNKLHTFKGHRDCVYTIQPSNEESVFFSGAGDGMVVQWDLRNPDQGNLIAKLDNSIYALHHHSHTGKLIIGHNYDGIHVIDWHSKKEAGSLKLTTAAIFDIKSFESNIIVTTGNGEVIVVDLDNLSVVKRLQVSQKSARCAAVNPELGEVAIGFSDCYIRVFDISDYREKYAWKAHENSIFSVGYSPEGSLLFSGSRDARLKVWDSRAGYTQVAEVVAHMYAINHLDFSPDSKHFVTCSMDKSIKVWDLAELRLLKVIDRARHAGHGTSVNKLLWTNYNGQLISASDDRTISIWDIQFEDKF